MAALASVVTVPAQGGWQGLRTWLAEVGIEPEFTWVVDASTVVGGVDDGAGAARWLLDVGATLATDRWFGLADSRAFVGAQAQRGRGVCRDVGSIEHTSNIDVEAEYAQLNELWFEQRLGDGWRYRIGKSDANADFAWSEHGGHFLHPSFGFSPTIHGMVTFPDPALGLVFERQLGARLIARTGVYNGAAVRRSDTGVCGTASLLSGQRRLFGMAEIEFATDAERGGRVVFGGHYHDGSFDDAAGQTKRGDAGIYAVCDQTLWRDVDGGREWSGFVQAGTSLSGVGPVGDYLGVGVVCAAPFSYRADDACGLAVNWSDLEAGAGSPFAGGSELQFEAFYSCQVTSWLRLMPDVQWFPSPAGAEGDAAVVFTLRGVVEF